MANLFSGNNTYRFILSLILSAFILTYGIPLGATTQNQTSFNELAFLYRVEKLVQRIWKLENSSNKDKMYDAMFDLKNEIEVSCRVKVDLGRYMDAVEKELKHNGFKPSKKEFDSIRSVIKKNESKRNKQKKIARSLILDNENVCHIENDLPLVESYTFKSSKQNHKDGAEAVDVPAQLVFGVTLTLCGLFLMVVPVPACKPWGERMIASGFVICGNCISGNIDKDKKDGKEKK